MHLNFSQNKYFGLFIPYQLLLFLFQHFFCFQIDRHSKSFLLLTALMMFSARLCVCGKSRVRLNRWRCQWGADVTEDIYSLYNRNSCWRCVFIESFYPLQCNFLILIVCFCSIDLSERKKTEACQLRVNSKSCFPVMDTKMLIWLYGKASDIHNLYAVFLSVLCQLHDPVKLH